MSRDDKAWGQGNAGTTNKTMQQGVAIGKGAKGMKEWYHYNSPKEGRHKGMLELERHHLTTNPGKDHGHSNTKPHARCHRRKTTPGTSGFRPGRSCCEQIFTLRQIIEKTLMWQTPAVINFVDFRKAFDSVHRESIWKILKTYGIPTKIIDVIKNFYEDSLCAVRCRGELGEWFRVVSGVRQGCVLSPSIFAIVVDWIMSRATGESTFGLKWTDVDRLTDLDFADDIALLDNTWDGIKQLTERVQTEAAKAGHAINPDKTKVMKIMKWQGTDMIVIEEVPIDEAEDF